jgi:hypothetical protein
MKKANEDDFLRPLFKKIKMEKAPDDITSGVMQQIMVNPEMDPAGKFYFNMWWIAVGLVSLVSVYLSGVYSDIYKLLEPYVIQIFQPFVEFFTGLYGLLPSNVVILLPSSVVLPAILAGILYVLIFDVLFGGLLKKVEVH